MDRNELLSSLLTASRAADENLLSALSATSDCLSISGKKLNLGTSYIGEIENGLKFVDNAIGEQRRFIRSDGEVLPIEKIKRASKESIVHLARHAEFVNRQSEQIVPEKLYSVERLNDYATYENRFLYSLLMLIKEFLDERHTFITKNDLSRIGLIMDKKVVASGQNLSVKLEVTREGCSRLTQEFLEKIEELRARTEFYLRTPLMEEASKEERIRTLVKTNVLKMDKNFIECAALYEFLLSYEHRDVEADFDRSVKLGERSAEVLNSAVLLLDEAMLAASEGDLFGACLNASEACFNRKKEELSGKGEEYAALLESRVNALQADVSRLKGEENRANELSKINFGLNERLDEANEQAAKNKALL